MKCVIFFASPNKRGTLRRLLDDFLDRASSQINTQNEIIYIGTPHAAPCTGCGGCLEGDCVLPDAPAIAELYEKALDADILIIASPVYFNSVPSQFKAVIDRLQPYYNLKFIRGNKGGGEKKPGVLLMCGGGREREETRLVLKSQLKQVFDVLGFSMDGFVLAPGSDYDDFSLPENELSHAASSLCSRFHCDT